MWQTSIILLLSFILSTLSISPSIVDFQEQYSKLSRSIEPQLRDYRSENEASRNQVAHRMLDALGYLAVEMRTITRDYWAWIQHHESVFPECLKRLREEFDGNVRDGEQDIRSMAMDFEGDLPYDASYRFNPVLSVAQQVNSRAIYQTVQTLGGKQILSNMTDTVEELQNELEF